jgi:hypothetical protein
MKPRLSLVLLVTMSIFFLWGQFYVFWHDSTALVSAATIYTTDLADAKTLEAVQAIHSRNLAARLSDVRFRAVVDSICMTLVLIVNFFALTRSVRKAQIDQPGVA